MFVCTYILYAYGGVSLQARMCVCTYVHNAVAAHGERFVYLMLCCYYLFVALKVLELEEQALLEQTQLS